MNNLIFYNYTDLNNIGIVFESNNQKHFVRFEECARNYAIEKGVKSSTCVASRDIQTLTFVFHTNPKTILIFKKMSIKNILRCKSAASRFRSLQKAITNAGYTTFDMS